ncbi:DUF5074 domain-containing protein [Pedobacter sp. JY14-1]|uniref:YncE family protein n=1 Tax=Pedobacter sp. JY14-1 TaxID=3034151 RepID=UPI0023E291F5|nr:DUF5074 domain-containing protein [Pedobacter sp. JY14-1]
MNTILHNGKRIALALLAVLTAFSSCKKDKNNSPDPGTLTTTGVYVLCEGSFGELNNSSISYYDIARNTVDKNYFRTQNGTDLGTDANDLKVYGSKLYCVVTGSAAAAKDSYLQVINVATGKLIKKIAFSDATKGFMPRSIVFYQNKAYVSGYDGYISKLDTASLTIESRLLVGGALEGLATANGKLYAANSSHPFYPSENNSSVSVVNISTFTKVKDIEVSFNPTKVAASAAGDVFVITSGQWAPYIAPAFEKLSSQADTKTQTYDDNLAALTISGSNGYAITGDYPAKLKTFNTATATTGPDFITDDTVVASLYGVNVNTLDGNVFVADATDYKGDGKMFCFDSSGKWKFDFATGTSPKIAVFNYGYK